MRQTLRQTGDKRSRYLDEAVVVYRPDDIPQNEAEFLALLDAQRIEDDGQRRRLLALWLAGVFILYLDYAKAYADRNGDVVNQEWLIDQLDKSVVKNGLYFGELAELYRNGDITLEELEAKMAERIEDAHYSAMILIFGASFVGVSVLWNLYQTYLTRELQFLRRFIEQIRSGQQRMDGTIARRARMYGTAVRALLFEAAREVAQLSGYTHEENELGPAEHCQGCLTETGKGKVPIGTLVPIGSRDCLSNCMCTLRFYRYNPITGLYEE